MYLYKVVSAALALIVRATEPADRGFISIVLLFKVAVTVVSLLKEKLISLSEASLVKAILKEVLSLNFNSYGSDVLPLTSN